MNAVARLSSITLECANADALARFYQALMGLEEEYASPDRTAIALRGEGWFLSCVQSDSYRAPTWPDGEHGQQVHLDLEVDELDAAVAAAETLGARLADFQPEPTQWRVLFDPAGHPFCLMLPFA